MGRTIAGGERGTVGRLGVKHEAEEAEQARLAESDLVALARVGRPRALRAGERLVLTDEIARFVLLVGAGRLKVTRVSPEGKQLILGFPERGDVLVLPGYRRGKGSGLEVEALEGSAFVVVPQQELEAFLRARPAAALAVMRQLAAQARVLEERMEELAFKNIGARLASALLRLAESYGSQEGGSGVILDLGLTQEDLAHFIGASREMVNHILAFWKRKSWVESRGGSIILRDPEVLGSLAGGEPLPVRAETEPGACSGN